MTTLAQRITSDRPLVTTAWRLLAPLAALHAAMLFYDLHNPDRFLRGDRSRDRIKVIEGFAQALQSGDPMAYITSHGIVGDWLPQALVYLAGGRVLLIAVQVVLVLASIVWVREIGLRIGLKDRHASGAALLYALLPHTLVFPHELATEAVFIPLVILAFRLSLPGLAPSGGAALGFATLIRPVAMLWPLVHAAVEKATPARRAAFLALALGPLLAWMSFMLLATGEFSMGRSRHDLQSNLYYRMQRIAATLPEDQRPQGKPEREARATLAEYARFALEHPGAVFAHSVRDTVVIAFKSGIERVTLDYLDLFPESRAALQQPFDGWRASVERRGALATMLDVGRTQPALIVSSALGALLFTVLIALALYGAALSLRRREWLILSLYVLYIAATAQAVDAAHSRHRAPAEFALCLLALAGWTSLAGRKEKRYAH